MYLNVATGEVHVWQVGLDLPEERLPFLQSLLSDEELDRARRYRFQRDWRRFVARRGLLRMVLSSYLEEHPAGLGFGYGPWGKPALANHRGGPASFNLSFNLSDSADRALIAVTGGAAVGVDLEHIATGSAQKSAAQEFATEDISRQFFSASEVAAWQSLPAEQRVEGFYLCWTRKEAFIKAKGEGLSLPLADFEVSLAPGEPAALLRTRPDAGEAIRWDLHSLDLGRDYAGALCVAGRATKVTLWNWPEIYADYC